MHIIILGLFDLLMCCNDKYFKEFSIWTTHLSAGVTYFVPIGLSISPLNLWFRRRMRTKPLRTSFLPVQRLGSQWPNSHMASGQGSFTWGPTAPSSRRTPAETPSDRGHGVHYDASVKILPHYKVLELSGLLLKTSSVMPQCWNVI